MQFYGPHISIPKKGEIPQQLTACAFFLASPRTWRTPSWDSKSIIKFKQSVEEHKDLSFENIVVHSCYLINPCSKNTNVRRKSKIRFIKEINLCDTLNVKNYVFHPGVLKDTQKGLQYTLDLINDATSDTKNVTILIENMTGTNKLCQTWQEVEWLLKRVNNKKRVGVCLDTAHCWGAGESKGMCMDTLLDDYDKIIGMKHLKAIHLNDSKVAYGSNKDRHEDILKGKIPKTFWKPFLMDKRIKKIPGILETPTNCRETITKIITMK